MWVPQKKLKQSYHIIQEFSFSVFMKNTNFKRYMCLYVHCSIIYNRLKESDLKDRVPEELWTEVRNTVQEAVTKIILKKKEMQEGKTVA